jgi:hypothetical protein
VVPIYSLYDRYGSTEELLGMCSWPVESAREKLAT